MTAGTRWTALERRQRLAARHLLDGSAPDALSAVEAVGCLHATDAATVYLSVLARSRSSSIASVERELYDARTLVRLMGMRRTMFVVPHELTATVHYSTSTKVAASLRTTLLGQLERLQTDPDLIGVDLDAWLDQLGAEVLEASAQLGPATGQQLSSAVPGLRTAFLPRPEKSYEVRRSITSQVLTLLGAQARLVRGRPRGGWTSRQHLWEPPNLWWPNGLEELTPAQAQRKMLETYLSRFGPASEVDLTWWTGWSKTAVQKALVGCEHVDGLWVAAGDDEVNQTPGFAGDCAALLPALDPTPMGWKQRDWYLPGDARPLFDAYGNIGPTVWWQGEVIGAWGIASEEKSPVIRYRLIADRGSAAKAAVEAARDALQPRLEGTVVTPAFRTPAEKQLASAQPKTGS